MKTSGTHVLTAMRYPSHIVNLSVAIRSPIQDTASSAVIPAVDGPKKERPASAVAAMFAIRFMVLSLPDLGTGASATLMLSS